MECDYLEKEYDNIKMQNVWRRTPDYRRYKCL